ncbi:MAG: 3-dehydroquinate dehydratase [Bacteroidales bacterium]|nr:3-dehydroquinate dehydratase [Bacteroidales bacterium]
MKLAIINGVNLGRLGTREVDIYGSTSFEDYFSELQKKFPTTELAYFQSDNLAELVAALRRFDGYDGIIFNPGAYTHTAIVLADAIGSINTPVVEVHISNLFGREMYRKTSMISSRCIGFISGFGLQGYQLAVQHFID